MAGRYSLSSVLKLLRNPGLLPEAVRLLRGDISEIALELDRRWYNHRYDGLGEEFILDDWDNLLILDAARPEFFKSTDIPNNVDVNERISPGSFSLQFMREQFFGRKLHDTVYVTANPHVSDLSDEVFHDVINLLQTDWDADLQTVRPEVVVDTGLSALETYPHKRLIIHFMQPHYPFLGPTGDEIPAGIAQSADGEKDHRHPWFDQMWEKEHDRETLIQAYRENHDIALRRALELVEGLSGRSVITSDHANLLGERGFPIPIRLYGHPRNFKHPNLLRVPWIEIEDERRDVVAEPPNEQNVMDQDVVEDRLEALGYR